MSTKRTLKGGNQDGEQKQQRRRNRGQADKADWGAADSTKVIAAICAVTKHGFAIRFGYTRDGGAFALGIVGDGDPFTEFVRPTEDIDLFLDGIAQDYET